MTKTLKTSPNQYKKVGVKFLMKAKKSKSRKF